MACLTVAWKQTQVSDPWTAVDTISFSDLVKDQGFKLVECGSVLEEPGLVVRQAQELGLAVLALAGC